jgi:hypothetical protein
MRAVACGYVEFGQLKRTGETGYSGAALLSKRDSGEVVLASLRGIRKTDTGATERVIKLK